MKTTQLTPEAMEARLARFKDLTPMDSQRNPKIPQQAADMIWARKLMPVITFGGDAPSPFGTAAPISGAGGMSIIVAACPPGTGPGLHAHHKTYETFTVLQGRFEITWGDAGEHSVMLDKFDTVSVPPGVCRAFTNISDGEGVLQVIITGGVHDIDDIAFPPALAEQLDRTGPGVLDEIKKTGLTFDAGAE